MLTNVSQRAEINYLAVFFCIFIKCHKKEECPRIICLYLNISIQNLNILLGIKRRQLAPGRNAKASQHYELILWMDRLAIRGEIMMEKILIELYWVSLRFHHFYVSKEG